MKGGQEIGVIGIGGLGHLAVQFAAKLGNRVTVFTSSPDKAEFAASLGASEAVLIGPGRHGSRKSRRAGSTSFWTRSPPPRTTTPI